MGDEIKCIQTTQICVCFRLLDMGNRILIKTNMNGAHKYSMQEIYTFVLINLRKKNPMFLCPLTSYKARAAKYIQLPNNNFHQRISKVVTKGCCWSVVMEFWKGEGGSLLVVISEASPHTSACRLGQGPWGTARSICGHLVLQASPKHHTGNKVHLIQLILHTVAKVLNI